ncbi:glycosyl transferase [Flavobacterium collinsii]|jgi:glycosyltransferase involved in cell wall biosynthesis|uniref:glycosyltransferase family A protein n=1 Tax=Flavobacterium collinsii TaxID=1114861 RepID=UPI0022C6E1FD|nr:glycosyltransferase family A protein [Flavobacterium collinsii]GIQ58566.1 glycosyl transferase [Flavobacterium collinsii]
MKVPLVSIIVPAYNQDQYLEEALQSVLNQSYQNWECIIVNDGSSDTTEEIAKQWVVKDNRFNYYYKKNGGVSSARNLGILNSSGKYILPLDADDKLGDDYISLVINEFQVDDSLCLVYTDASFFGTRNELWHLPVFDFKNLLLSNCIYCSAIFKKEDFLRVGGYDEKFKYGNEDWEFWINLLSKHDSPKVKKISYLGFFYRRKLISRDVELNNDPVKQDETLFEIYKKHNLLYEKHFGSYIENVKKSKRLRANIQTLLSSEKLILNLFTEKFFGFKLFKIKEINF